MILVWPAAGLLGLVVWNVLGWRKVGDGKAPQGSISVLIPARNEEHRLPECLQSLSREAAAEILVYDDHSEDATARVIQDFAHRDPRIRAIAPQALPPGWCGKNFACAQLASAATGDWLLFLDADVRLTFGAAARIAADAERHDVTLLSCWPGFAMRGFWENLLMPMLNFTVFTLFPAPLATRRADVSLGLAHGACILTRRKTYERLGGHALVRGEIFEDTRLARVWREKEERSLCLDGQEAVQVRMYSGADEIWRGFQKNFYPAFQHSANFWLFLAMHAGLFLLPFLRADLGGMAIVWGARTLLAMRFRRPSAQKWWSIALHPLAELALIGIGLSSWWMCRGGRGPVWKGRVLRV